jgi:hypothetical protein
LKTAIFNLLLQSKVRQYFMLQQYVKFPLCLIN